METRCRTRLHAPASAAMVLLFVILVPSAAGHAAGTDDVPGLTAPRAAWSPGNSGIRLTRIRTTNARIRRAFVEGMSKAPTFRALAARLEASDILIYVETGECAIRGVRACLTFVTRAGSMRLLRATVSLEQMQMEVVASIGHELSHAVEIAGAPEVVDVPTMKRFYEARALFRCVPACGYETAAARRAQIAVRTEFARWKPDSDARP